MSRSAGENRRLSRRYQKARGDSVVISHWLRRGRSKAPDPSPAPPNSSLDHSSIETFTEARALTDPIPHLLIWVDVKGRIRFLNRHYTELTGHDREDAVVRQSWREYIHLDDVAALSALLGDRRRWESGVKFEFRLRHADGSYRWMLLSARSGADAAIGELWQAMASDIQARMSAEEELRELQQTFEDRLARQTAELARTEARYSSLFSVSKIAFAEQEMVDAALILNRLKQEGVTDLAMYMGEHPEVLQECVAAVRTVSVNEACMRMLGFDDVDGAVDRPVDSTAEDIETVLLRQFEMIFYGLESVEGRVMLIGAEGRRVPVFYSVTRLADERQLSSLIDISSQERIEEMRLAAQEELARANRVATVGAFSASIAHELNQPVASVSIDANTGLRLLRREAPDVTAAIRVLERMSSTTQRIATIVKHTHDQITSGHQLVDRIDLVELVSRTCDLLARDVRSLGINLRYEREDEIPDVMGNFVDLQQVLINLINNARDSMSDETAGKDILIDLRLVGDDVQLSVSDHGGLGSRTRISVGCLSPSSRPRREESALDCKFAFRRFSDWAERNASNRPGRGATFAFKLPVATS